jgi:predicted Zn finger-like uncharacterized protein
MMYTQCPHCHTLFRISMDQLATADGNARCCRCEKVFDALGHLREAAPSQAEPRLHRRAAREPERPTDTETVSNAAQSAHTSGTGQAATAALSQPAWSRRRSEPRPATLAPKGPSEIDHPEALSIEIPEDLPEIKPSAEQDTRSWEPEIEPPPRPSLLARLGWSLGVLALLALLLAQTVWWAHDRLAKHPQGRRVAMAACAVLGCEVPPRRAPERIRVLSRDISPHPSEPHALLVVLVMSNEAPFPQPFPLLQIVLFDDNQNALGHRSFTPQEYLARSDPDLMKPHHAVYVKLELVDPGSQVTGFRMEFL